MTFHPKRDHYRPRRPSIWAQRHKSRATFRRMRPCVRHCRQSPSSGCRARRKGDGYFNSTTTTDFAGTLSVTSEPATLYALNGPGFTALGLSNVFIAFIAGAVNTSPVTVRICRPVAFAVISAGLFGSRLTTDRCTDPLPSRDAEA